MITKNKKLFALAGLALLMSGYILCGLISKKENTVPPTGNATTTANTEPQQTLSNRDLAIQEALKNPDKLRRAQINGETYLLTGYDDTFYGYYGSRSHGPRENSPGRPFGGILVYKLENGKPVLFWESKEYISKLFVSFRDIDSDGTPEIVFDGYIGVTGRDNAIYVYKFVDNTVKLITPFEELETTIFPTKFKYRSTLLGGTVELTYIKDIDNDGIQEIVVGSDNEDGTKDMKIYKFNGSKYYLWKEMTEPYTAVNP